MTQVPTTAHLAAPDLATRPAAIAPLEGAPVAHLGRVAPFGQFVAGGCVERGGGSAAALCQTPSSSSLPGVMAVAAPAQAANDARDAKPPTWGPPSRPSDWPSPT
jgi:hypothetical protein